MSEETQALVLKLIPPIAGALISVLLAAILGQRQKLRTKDWVITERQERLAHAHMLMDRYKIMLEQADRNQDRLIDGYVRARKRIDHLEELLQEVRDRAEKPKAGKRPC